MAPGEWVVRLRSDQLQPASYPSRSAVAAWSAPTLFMSVWSGSMRMRPDDTGKSQRRGLNVPYRNGYAAYVRVTTPDGKRRRKWVYGQSRETVHDKWVKLHAAARSGPVATSSPTLADYLAYWLREMIFNRITHR